MSESEYLTTHTEQLADSKAPQQDNPDHPQHQHFAIHNNKLLNKLLGGVTMA